MLSYNFFIHQNKDACGYKKKRTLFRLQIKIRLVRLICIQFNFNKTIFTLFLHIHVRSYTQISLPRTHIFPYNFFFIIITSTYIILWMKSKNTPRHVVKRYKKKKTTIFVILFSGDWTPPPHTEVHKCTLKTTRDNKKLFSSVVRISRFIAHTHNTHVKLQKREM